MSLPTVTIAGTVDAPDTTGLNEKNVYFSVTAEMVSDDGTQLVPATYKGKGLIVNGAIKAADGTSPLEVFDSNTGSATVPYLIQESWHGGRTFTVNLTADMQVDGAIPYATLGPVSPAPTATSPYVRLSQVGVADGVASLDDTGNVPSDQLGNVSGGGGGDVASVFGRTGAVTAQSGDYSAAQVGADTAAARDTAIATAVGPLASSSALASEVTRAEAAEASNAAEITAETTRAEGVEATKADASALTAESTARSNADAAEIIARDAAIASAVSNLIDGAPGALDTLKELADAINDDASFAATVTTALAGKQPLDADLTAIAALSTTAFGRAFLTMTDAAATKTVLSLVKADVGLGSVDNTSDSGKPVSTAQAAADTAVQTAAASDATTKANSAQSTAEAYTDAETTRATTAEALLAPKASPALTGNPTAPTQAAADNSTKVGTTAYADRAVATETTRAEAAEALLLALPPTYTTAGRPTATGSKAVIFVSDLNGGTLQQDTASGVWTSLAPGVSQGNLGLITSASITANTPAAGTTSTSDIDLTGLSVTFTAVAGAEYELRLCSVGPGNLTADAKTDLSICDSSNNRLQFITQSCHATATGYPVFLVVPVTPGAGSVTYKARIRAVTGTAFITALPTAPTILSAYRIA